jgi:6-phosphogluconolactonase (cycloisomerase 2 family)
MSRLNRRLAALLASWVAACGSHHDAGGGSGTSNLAPPSNLTYPADPSLYVVDIGVAPNVPSFHGTVDQFSIEPALPLGLALNPASGVISGTPAVPESRTVHTVRAENAGGATEFSLRITVAAPPRFAYSVSDDSTIAIFSADVASGRLQRKGYIAAVAGEIGPEKLIVHPSSKFLYVPNSISNNLSAYTIDLSTGWLTPLAPTPLGSGPHQMVIDPTGRIAYVSNRGSDQIRVYSIDAVTGALTAIGSPVATGTQPSALALDPSGKLLFVALRGDPTTGAGSAISVFDVDPQTGAIALAAQSLTLGTAKPIGLNVDPGQSRLYVIEESAASLASFHFDPATGALETIDARALGAQPSDSTVHPIGNFAFVSDFNTTSQAGTVAVVRIDPSSGSLSDGGSAASGLHPTSVTIDPTGKFVYVTGHDTSDITEFAIDASSGALTPVDEVLTRIGPTDFAIAQGPHAQAWTPRFVHVTNGGSNDVSAFEIDPATGSLSDVGRTTAAGAMPVSLAVDPRQRCVYVANHDSSDIGIYALSPSTGGLFQVAPNAAVSGYPTHLTVEPSGRFLYVVVEGAIDSTTGWLCTFSVNPTLGTLSPIDAQSLSSRPAWVTTDPTGQYLYVANSGNGLPGTGNVSAYRLPVATGIPLGVGTSQTPGIDGLGFHPSGKYMYAMLKHSDAMVEFTLNVNSGVLTLFPAVARAGLEPSSITPNGRWAYVAFTNSSDVGHTSLLAIDPETGFLLTPASPAQDGVHPVDLGVDPSGRFLYVANNGSNNVSVMSIDPSDGMLTILTPKPCGIAPNAILVTGITQ